MCGFVTGNSAQTSRTVVEVHCLLRLMVLYLFELYKSRIHTSDKNVCINMNINDIIEAIRANRIRITDHADEEAQADGLTFDEIFFSVFQGEIIESYITDRPYPSFLIYGCNFRGEPVHSVWAYNERSRWAVLITVYRPDPQKWIDWRKRR
ncbi:MAG: DUF4258 domain-containing protein [Thermodesulfobacteriota bacterium]